MVKMLKPTGPKIDANGRMVKPNKRDKMEELVNGSSIMNPNRNKVKVILKMGN